MLLRFSTSFDSYVKRSSAANEVSSFCNAIVVVWLHPFEGYDAQAFTKLNHFLCVCGSLSTFSRQRIPATAIQVMSMYSVLLDTFTSHSFQFFVAAFESGVAENVPPLNSTLSRSTILFIIRTFSFAAAAAAAASSSEPKPEIEMF